MFRRMDLSLFQKERRQPKLSNIFKQENETKPVPAEETSVKSRLRERFPRLFGTKKSNKIIPVVKMDNFEKFVPTRFMDIDTTVFAHEMTMLEKEFFCGIELKEIMNGTWRKQNQPHLCPNITGLRNYDSRIAGIIVTEVISKKEVAARAEIIAKVIEIANCCANLYNYQAVKTLLGALQAFPVARLQKTWKRIPRSSKRLLRQLIVLSSGSQHALYMRHKTACENSPNSLQCLSDVLTQMSYIEEVIYVNGKKSKSAHSRKLTELFELLASYQNAARGYFLKRHPAISWFLTSATVNSVDENLVLSKKREPDDEKKPFY